MLHPVGLEQSEVGTTFRLRESVTGKSLSVDELAARYNGLLEQLDGLRAAAEAYLIEATPDTLRALNAALSAKE